MSFFSKLAKAVNPVEHVKAAVKVTKAVAKPSTLKLALNPVAQVKATVGAAKTVGGKVTTAAKVLHLPSIAAQLDVRKAITNPKGYVSDMVGAYGKDIAFAGEVYGRFKSGDIKGLASQAASETVQALGGSKGAQQTAAAVGGTLGAIYAKAKGIKPPAPTPSVSQVTGEPPMPPTGLLDAVPMTYTPAPPAPVELGVSKRGLVIALGAAAALVVVVLVTRG
jgi:hypothetical protein